MTILRVGTNDKYANGWEAAFGKSKSKKKATAQQKGNQKKAGKKKSGKKKSGKK